MRFTKIIATIGPSTGTTDAILKLAQHGVGICRLNFSHGTYKDHEKVIDSIRAVNKKGFSLGIMIDTKGPEVRTGDVRQAIQVKKGQSVIFTSHATKKEKLTTITVDYDHFAEDVPSARCILLDNGAIEFKLESVERNGNVIAKALESGSIGSRRHINLPGAHISLPSFTEKDWQDIRFGIDCGVDFFATSFVRTGKDIQTLRAFLQKHKSHGEIIAKIETPQAVDNIDDIVDAANGIMIARGDLGAEVPFEDVPHIQEKIVEKCRRKGKPVIVATHMLESMILSPMPTRAEVTDVAYAARLQADCAMLSGETASGLFPFKAVAAMDRVLRRNERIEPNYDLSFRHTCPATTDQSDDGLRREQALAASVLATKIRADAIVAITRTGRTARAVSNSRPLVPIHAFTDTEICKHHLMLLWGVTPHCIPFSADREQTLLQALAHAEKEKFLKKGQRIVAVSDIRTGSTSVMTIQIREI
jgi:pyruvate kinase